MTASSKRYVGQSIKRVGDGRLVTGNGTFVDDIHLPDTLHLTFVRSPYAHARVTGIDTSEAERLPGVVAIYTGEQIVGMVQPQQAEELSDGKQIVRYPLVTDRVRFVGDAVVAVVAQNTYTARDAAELVRVDYEPLPAVIDAEEAIQPGASKLFDDWDSNLAWQWHVENGDVDGAFAEADQVVSIRLVNQRVHATFVEPRTYLTCYQPTTGEMTIWGSTQGPHRQRSAIASAIGLPEHHIRSIAPDVGGAFGSKGAVYPEYLVVAALSCRHGLPVKWVESRSESFLGVNHGRDQIQKLRASVRNDGTVLGLDVEIIGNLGAYTAATVPQRTGIMSSGAYAIQNLRVNVFGAMTNTTPTGAYRGAGRPEAAYMIERLMDRIASQLGIDPAEVRRRNFIPADAFPYQGATGAYYDSGDYNKALDEALKLVDYSGYRVEQEQGRRVGRLLGLGMAVYCEFAGPGWDSASVRVQPSGTVTVAVGVSPHGQGEETSFAQIVADELGVDMSDIVIRASDTAVTPQGTGTFGSRGTSVGGSAVLLATRQVVDKARKISAGILEVAEEDLDFIDGQFRVRGAPDRMLDFKQVARSAYGAGGLPPGIEPGLEATSYFMPEGRTFPFGAHVALVEIDPSTGSISVLRYVAVDDCGPLINPMLVEGQVQGGLAQGFGQALQEAIVYDESGQLLTGTLMDYAAPRAHQLPNFETAHTVTPSPFNPLGVKGVGEAGTTGAPPALVNAVLDALGPLGTEHIDMPLTSEKVWRAVQTAREGANS